MSLALIAAALAALAVAEGAERSAGSSPSPGVHVGEMMADDAHGMMNWRARAFSLHENARSTRHLTETSSTELEASEANDGSESKVPWPMARRAHSNRTSARLTLTLGSTFGDSPADDPIIFGGPLSISEVTPPSPPPP
jgi:hypothetical protein